MAKKKTKTKKTTKRVGKKTPAKKAKRAKSSKKTKLGALPSHRNLRLVETNPFIVWGSRPGKPDPTFWYIDFSDPKAEKIVSPWVHLVFECIKDRVPEAKILDKARVMYNARLDHHTLWQMIANMRQDGLLAFPNR